MLDITIIYEDTDILAINKPTGLVVHPDGRTEEPSVAEWFVGKYPEAKDVGEPIKLAPSTKELEASIERPGVVHRLDRDTSGVLLLAKTEEGFECLKKQFQRRNIEKVYSAFVYGHVKDDRGSIRLPIGRSASDFRKRSATRGAKGDMREALTYFEVLARAGEAQERVSFVEAKPKTGRTHQIRVHFQAVHHPVVADKLYAPKSMLGNGVSAKLGFDRLALHARRITFKTTSGESVTVQAEYPEDFQQALEKLDFKP